MAFVAYAVRLPYFVIGPGPARDVEPLIHVSGTQTFPSGGHLLLTAVTIRQANAYDLFGAWLDPASSVLPERDILAPGETQEQEAEVARSEMDTSKIDAAIVALSGFANYPAEHGQGALVEAVDPGTPADGNLFAGDVIVAIDGAAVRSPDDLGAKIAAGGAGKGLCLDGHQTGGGTSTSCWSCDLNVARPSLGFAAPVTTGWNAEPACASRFEPLPLNQASGSVTTWSLAEA